MTDILPKQKCILGDTLIVDFVRDTRPGYAIVEFGPGSSAEVEKAQLKPLA